MSDTTLSVLRVAGQGIKTYFKRADGKKFSHADIPTMEKMVKQLEKRTTYEGLSKDERNYVSRENWSSLLRSESKRNELACYVALFVNESLDAVPLAASRSIKEENKLKAYYEEELPRELLNHLFLLYDNVASDDKFVDRLTAVFTSARERLLDKVEIQKADVKAGKELIEESFQSSQVSLLFARITETTIATLMRKSMREKLYVMFAPKFIGDDFAIFMKEQTQTEDFQQQIQANRLDGLFDRFKNQEKQLIDILVKLCIALNAQQPLYKLNLQLFQEKFTSAVTEKLEHQPLKERPYYVGTLVSFSLTAFKEVRNGSDWYDEDIQKIFNRLNLSRN